MMNSTLKFYTPPLIIGLLCLTYLILFLLYDWFISDYKTFNDALATIIFRNPRWITWGGCASGPALIAGLMLAIGLLFSSSSREFFESFENNFSDLQKEYVRRGLPRFREISLFFVLVIITMLVINLEDWQLGLRNGLEIIAVCVWVVFLVTTLTIVPTILVHVFHRSLHNLLLRITAKKEDSDGLF